MSRFCLLVEFHQWQFATNALGLPRLVLLVITVFSVVVPFFCGLKCVFWPIFLLNLFYTEIVSAPLKRNKQILPSSSCLCVVVSQKSGESGRLNYLATNKAFCRLVSSYKFLLEKKCLEFWKKAKISVWITTCQTYCWTPEKNCKNIRN